MGCLTPPSHKSVRMKFVVILSFLLLGVALGDPYRGYYGGHHGGYLRGGYGGYHGYRGYGKRSADADAAPVADAYGRRGYGHGVRHGGFGGRGYGGYGGRGFGHGKRDAEPEPIVEDTEEDIVVDTAEDMDIIAVDQQSVWKHVQE